MSIAFASRLPAEAEDLASDSFDVLLARSKLEHDDRIYKNSIALIAFTNRRTERLQLRRFAAELNQLSGEISACTSDQVVKLLQDSSFRCNLVFLTFSWGEIDPDRQVENFVHELVAALPDMQFVAVAEQPGSWPLPPSVRCLKAREGELMRTARAAFLAMAACTLAPIRVWDHDAPDSLDFSPFGPLEAPSVLIEAAWRNETRKLLWRNSEDKVRISGFTFIQLFSESDEDSFSFIKALLREVLPEGQAESGAGWWFEIAPGMLLPSAGPNWIWPIWMICRP